jgi:hypothetical protein
MYVFQVKIVAFDIHEIKISVVDFFVTYVKVDALFCILLVELLCNLM